MVNISLEDLNEVKEHLLRYKMCLSLMNKRDVSRGLRGDDVAEESEKVGRMILRITNMSKRVALCASCKTNESSQGNGVVTGRDGWVCEPCRKQHYSLCDNCEGWFTDDQLTVSSSIVGDTFCLDCFKGGVDL